MTKTIIKAQVRTADWLKRFRQSEFGQGATEYAGAIIIASLLIAAFIGAATQWGEDIKTAVDEAIKKILKK